MRSSIGKPVSFFYQIARSSDIRLTPLQLLQPAQRYHLGIVDDSLLLQSDLQLDAALYPVSAVKLPESTAGAASVLRLFGDTLHWPIIIDLLQLLNVQSRMLVGRCIKPHSELAGAIELELPELIAADTLQRLSELALQADIELVYLPGNQARPSLADAGLLVMDMDSTAIQIECIDEIAKLAGVGDQVSAVTARAMNGELDFAQSLIARVAALKQAPESVLAEVLEGLPLMPGLEALVQHLQSHGWHVVIASGGFTYFTEALRVRLGLYATYANQLEIIDGRLTGQVLGEIVDAQKKAEVVTQLLSQLNLAAGQTVAIGDGANDLPMLKTAALGVAFHAKPAVQAQAKAAIRHGSLLQLLYLLAIA